MGGLEIYREVLEKIFDDIDKAKCKISARTDGGPSIHEFPDISGTCRIRISFSKKYSDPIKIIWVILHEFGHHLSGIKQGDQDTIRREELAWDHAKQEVLKYPTLIERLPDFEKFRDELLEGYRSKLS